MSPHLPTAVLPPDQMAQIAARLHELPIALTTSFGFECRLHADPQVDVQCGVRRGREGHRLLARGAPPEAWQSHPAWRHIQRFACRWLHDEALALTHIVLAFDMDGHGRPPMPWMHLRTETLDHHAIVPLVEWIRGQSLPPPIIRSVQRCLEAGPPPMYLGLSTARGPDTLRWTLPSPLDAALPFLEKIGWPGRADRVAPWLDAASSWATHVGLSLNVGERVEPYLGLELLNWAKPRAHAAAWQQCLATLVRGGLCTPDRADALLTYPGISHERGGPWPEALRTEDAYREHAVRVLVRSLLHVKISFSPDGAPSAKAYLQVQHGWIDLPSASILSAPSGRCPPPST